MKCFRQAVVFFGLVCLAVHGASAAGRRISAQDIVLVAPGLQALTFVAVTPGFDYGTCMGFPRPMDLRCDLFAEGGFDADGRQYAVRYTNSDVNALLPRTEIWRTSLVGGSELVASLDPRANELGGFDDGRIEKIAVDPVQGHLYLVLTTTCFPPDQDACSYSSRANEIVRIIGLRSLAEVLNLGTTSGPDAPPSGPSRGFPRVAPRSGDEALTSGGGPR